MTKAAQSQSKVKSATAQSSTSSAAPTGPTIDLAAVGACALLTPAAANAVAVIRQLIPKLK